MKRDPRNTDAPNDRYRPNDNAARASLPSNQQCQTTRSQTARTQPSSPNPTPHNSKSRAGQKTPQKSQITPAPAARFRILAKSPRLSNALHHSSGLEVRSSRGNPSVPRREGM